MLVWFHFKALLLSYGRNKISKFSKFLLSGLSFCMRVSRVSQKSIPAGLVSYQGSIVELWQEQNFKISKILEIRFELLHAGI